MTSTHPGARDDVERIYRDVCAAPSDIHEHLPTLRRLAERSRDVVEFGVRTVVSTWAFLAARPPRGVKSIDIAAHPNVFVADAAARAGGVPWLFVQADTLQLDPIPCDLLFIDTLHVYRQLRVELARHGPLARRFIAMHDTVTFGAVGEDGTEPGLRLAIEQFLAAEPDWRVLEEHPNNNGLTVLARLGVEASA